MRDLRVALQLALQLVVGIGVSGAPTGEIDASCAADGINAMS